MTSCRHQHLMLIPAPKSRVRCRYCHLTISLQELAGGYCPECYDSSGKRRYDFEDVADVEADRTQYRCEDCGVMIDCE